jgi:hypothetical protein
MQTQHEHKYVLNHRHQMVCAVCGQPYKPNESEASRKLRLVLRVAKLAHSYSMAQQLGIYPA